MLVVTFGDKIGSPDVEKKSGEHREEETKGVLGDSEQKCHQHTGDGRDRVDKKPAKSFFAFAAVAHDDIDGIDTVAEVVRQDCRCDDCTNRSGNLKREADADAVKERVDRKRAGPDSTARFHFEMFLLFVRVIVQQDKAIEDEIQNEAKCREGDDGRELVRFATKLERFRHQVEKSHGDDRSRTEA